MRRGILIEQTIRDFERTEDALEEQIRAEEEYATDEHRLAELGGPAKGVALRLALRSSDAG